MELKNFDREFLSLFSDIDFDKDACHSFRLNGEVAHKYSNENIKIEPKEDGSGIDIIVRAGAEGDVFIPVLVTESGMIDRVVNDFYIGKDANVRIYAGCGIDNCGNSESEHNGVHNFHIESGANVVYVEKHIGRSRGGANSINPITSIEMAESSSMSLQAVQISGIDETERAIVAKLGKGAKLVINEKLFTELEQYAQTLFEVELIGTDSTLELDSRSVATGNSTQTFISSVEGRAKCFAHVSCDAIIADSATVESVPQIRATSPDASLIHEAAIGRISNDQIVKLMTLGLTEEEAQRKIIKGFLR